MAERGGRHYPAVDSPSPALNKAAAWAIGQVGGVLRVDPAGSTSLELDESVDGIVEDAERWYRVRANDVIEPQEFLGRVVGILWGARLGGVGGRLELRPDLPDGWKAMRVRRLRAHRTLLDLEVKRRAEWVTLRLAVMFGPGLAVAASLPETSVVSRVTVDEIPLQGPRAIFTAASEHELVFWLGAPAGTP